MCLAQSLTFAWRRGPANFIVFQAYIVAFGLIFWLLRFECSLLLLLGQQTAKTIIDLQNRRRLKSSVQNIYYAIKCCCCCCEGLLYFLKVTRLAADEFKGPVWPDCHVIRVKKSLIYPTRAGVIRRRQIFFRASSDENEELVGNFWKKRP